MLQSSVRRGELDRQIYLIKPVTANDSANANALTNWALVDEHSSVYGRKKELNGREVVVADRLTYVQTTLWVILYREDLSTRNRVVFNGRPYEITAILEIGRGQYLELHTNLIDTETWP